MKHVVVDISPYLKEVEGSAYIPWARALALAGNPQQEVILHPVTNTIHPVFGGAAVAVRQGNQETWLPVIDARSQPIPFGGITARDVGDALNRARARSVAMVNGLGLGLYLDQPVGLNFVRSLGVTSETADLSAVSPITSEKKDKDKPNSKGPVYVPWPASLAAAALTDPEFRWSFAWFDTADDHGELSRQPYARLPKGYMVAVDLVWKGQQHREYLPIMGILPTQTKNGIKNLDFRTLLTPTVHDWHRAVMRCLAKGIAILTGYGRSVYATDVASPPVFADSLMIEEITSLAFELGIPMEAVLKKAGVPTVDALSPIVADRVLGLLKAKKAATNPSPSEASIEDVAAVAAVAATTATATVVNMGPAVPETPKPAVAATPATEPGSDAPTVTDLLLTIEQEAKAKGVSDEMLRGFFGKPVSECSTEDLNRVLRALQRAVPSAQRKAG